MTAVADPPKAALNVPVSFGGVSLGQETARIGIKIDRKNLTLAKADKAFSGRRLIGRIVLGHEDESPDQTQMFDSDYCVEGAFDVKRYGVNSVFYATGLTFGLADVDIEELSHFSKGTGRLIVDEIAELPEPEPEDKTPKSGALKFTGKWADVRMDEIFKPESVIAKGFAAKDIVTVGDMVNWQKDERNQLIDLPDVGPKKVQEIEDTMMVFWASNPEAAEQAAGEIG